MPTPNRHKPSARSRSSSYSEQDRANGIDPSTRVVVEAGPPAAPPASIGQIMAADPPDWEHELAQRRAAERAVAELEGSKILAEELERLAAEDTERRPAKPRRWRA